MGNTALSRVQTKVNQYRRLVFVGRSVLGIDCTILNKTESLATAFKNYTKKKMENSVVHNKRRRCEKIRRDLPLYLKLKAYKTSI